MMHDHINRISRAMYSLSIIMWVSFMYNIIAAVQGVKVSLVNTTAVNVSWSALIIPRLSIDYYTVLYSPMSRQMKREDGEMSAVFPSNATYGIITSLNAAVAYQFQVFATVTVNGTVFQGEKNSPISITREWL